MMFRHRLLWMLHVCLVSGRTDCVLTRDNWHFDPKIENHTTDTDLLSTNENITKVDCARRCSQYSQCLSFFYTKTTGICRLHSNRFAKGAPKTDVTYIPGTKFYTDKCSLKRFHHSDKTGKYFKLKLRSMSNRTEALQFCESIGATLGLVKTSADVDVVKDMYADAIARHSAQGTDVSVLGFWLDATYDNATGKFTWSDETAVNFISSMPYSSMPGQVVDHSFCVVLLLASGLGYTMDSYSCEKEHNVNVYPLCECVP